MAIGAPAALAWAGAGLQAAGWLKLRHGVKTGYTRKLFHFQIFSTASAAQLLGGLSWVFVLGGATTLVLLYALVRGDGHPMYEAIARESDAPHRTRYIVAPYFATLLGGLASNALFGAVAMAGYLVTGVADAIGEPVGTRWGRHRYRAWSLGSVRASRSLEGSAAVFLASLVCLALAVLGMPEIAWTPRLGYALPAIAAACCVAEALSPHGWDNATLQLVPSFLVAVWLVA